MVTLGGIIGAQLTPDPKLATLPVSVMVLFGAATAIPATMIMRRIGRRVGFSLASLSSVVAMLFAGLALQQGSFVLLIVAGATFGLNMAFGLQYRYAAAESVDPRYSPRAISFVLLGAIGGALLGPKLVTYGQFAISEVQYAGTFIALGILYFLQSLLHLTLIPMRGENGEVAHEPQRALSAVAAQPVFIVAVLGGATAYGVMTFVMTATPLSMHVHDGYALDVTAEVIRAHVLAMYVPSLVSGILIEKFGMVRMMAIGASGLIAACLVGLQGQEYMHYWGALVLLGVGWNFLYVGGTTMITRSYRDSERFSAQGVNEFCVFGMSALASLLAGTVIHAFGWFTLVLVPLPLLALSMIGLLWVRKDPLLSRLQAAAA